MTGSTMTTKGKWLFKLLAAGILLAAWQLFSMSVGQEILVVSPLVTAKRMGELCHEVSFWQTVCRSCLRVLSGFALGALIGSLLAVLTSFLPFVNDLVSPVMGIVKATPVSSFIILALIWLKTQNLSIFISFLMVLPMAWTNVSQGIRETDGKLLEMAKLFGFSRLKTLRRVYLPSVRPYFLAACTTGVGFAWKAGIAAEVLGTPKGTIGRELYNAKIYLETPDLFAWTAVVILMSVLIEKGMVALFRRLSKRGRSSGRKI